jgi:NAD(P)-dependent dehydrogenase (short-subunit alcohol dehydrogenase family)
MDVTPTPDPMMAVSGRFQGKVAIVTGASGGIGGAIVKRLAAEGCKLTLANRDAPKAEDAKQHAIAHTPAEDEDIWNAAPCNVGNEEDVIAAVKGTLERFGRLDYIVNNAGVMTFKPLEELTREDWYQVLDVDLLGAFYFVKQGFLHMKPGSAIVNVSSVHAVQTSPLVAPYAAAKAAACSLTRTAGIEGKPKGIRVNAILPGAIDTPMLWDNPNIKSGAEKVDEAYVGKPDDIAAAVAFLLSDDAAFMTGASVDVDGGRLAKL